MIRFYKKIRQQLLSDNKFRKYLFYAIGEIVLVVIGILIALWVNNLNIKNQQRVDEASILKELKKDFQEDIRDFQIGMRHYKNISTSVDLILESLESTNGYNDSLDKYFARTIAWPISVIHKNSLDVLKSKGLGLISNDSLRKEILYFHGTVYTSIKNWENYLNRDMYFEEMIKRFDKVEPWKYDKPGEITNGKMKPNNYNALKTDTLYLSILRTMKRDAEFLLYGRYLNNIEKLESLIVNIDKELAILDE